jgi:hypothetical protein
MFFIFSLWLVCAPASAEYRFGSANVSLNYLDWSQGTENKSPKEDFAYAEIEGYAAHSWGDIYAFFDVENPGKTGHDVRSAGKAVVNRYLWDTKISVYGHLYNFTAHGFSEQNRVLGLGYSLEGKGWWFKPFLGLNDVSQTYFSGLNGYMGGFVWGYNFVVAGQNFMAAQWHEYEFARRRSYAAGQGGSTSSHNGAVSLWWNAPRNFSLGVQGRYAHSKLGTAGSLGAMIYSLKYLF